MNQIDLGDALTSYLAPLTDNNFHLSASAHNKRQMDDNLQQTWSAFGLEE